MLGLRRQSMGENPNCVLTDRFGAGNMRANFAEVSVVQLRRGIAQSGSAPALGAGCREFESLHPDHIEKSKCKPVKMLYYDLVSCP